MLWLFSFYKNGLENCFIIFPLRHVLVVLFALFILPDNKEQIGAVLVLMCRVVLFMYFNKTASCAVTTFLLKLVLKDGTKRCFINVIIKNQTVGSYCCFSQQSFKIKKSVFMLYFLILLYWLKLVIVVTLTFWET